MCLSIRMAVLRVHFYSHTWLPLSLCSLSPEGFCTQPTVLITPVIKCLLIYLYLSTRTQALKHFLKCPSSDDSVAIEMAIEAVSITEEQLIHSLSLHIIIRTKLFIRNIGAEDFEISLLIGIRR